MLTDTFQSANSCSREEAEHNSGNALANALSSGSFSEIQKRMCRKPCCCKSVTLIIEFGKDKFANNAVNNLAKLVADRKFLATEETSTPFNERKKNGKMVEFEAGKTFTTTFDCSKMSGTLDYEGY